MQDRFTLGIMLSGWRYLAGLDSSETCPLVNHARFLSTTLPFWSCLFPLTRGKSEAGETSLI